MQAGDPRRLGAQPGRCSRQTRIAARTTFTVSPRRGRVLVGKAVVLGSATFVVSLVACLAAYLVALHIRQANGFAPPSYPTPALTDGPVVRAIAGTSLVMALFAVLSLCVGAILRRTASAIALVIAFTTLATTFHGIG